MMTHSFSDFLAQVVILLPAFLISLSFHEFAHAWVATRFGDSTPSRMGRLTLNPLAHIDPMGLLFLLIFRIGWAKPVIFDQRNFKSPRLHSILTALAGPFSNYLLALFCFYFIAYFPSNFLSPAVSISLLQILKATAYVNIMLGTFNILPIPPLDGSHVITAFLAKSHPEILVWLYRYSMFILIGLFILPPTRLMLVRLIFIAEYLIRSLVF